MVYALDVPNAYIFFVMSLVTWPLYGAIFVLLNYVVFPIAESALCLRCARGLADGVCLLLSRRPLYEPEHYSPLVQDRAASRELGDDEDTRV
ncbi:MAG TPA: hypothetical protein VLD39_05825 [Gammaproteobacteria bacterium]|nr:hypothetical protein [Gammaproteobacteria bacterium]